MVIKINNLSLNLNEEEKMTGGTEFTEAEAPEAPKTEEVQESPKEVAEAKEVAEVARSTTAAVETPEAIVEKGDFTLADKFGTGFCGSGS